MDSLIEALADKGGSLIRVEYLCSQESSFFVRRIALYFQNKVCFLTADKSDDSLEIAEHLSETFLDELKAIDYSNKEPWIYAIGREACWIWIMTNQQGYLDGIQFEFINDITKEEPVIIQLMVIASSIEVRMVSYGSLYAR